MDPTDHDEPTTDDFASEDALAVVATNRWFVLGETPDGYGIWPLEADRTGPPIVEFGEDEQGFAAADTDLRRRTREIRLFAVAPTYLAWVIVVAVTLWVVSSLVTSLWSLNLFWIGPDAFEGEAFGWVQAISSMTYSLWVGALAILIMLWLLRRSREDPIV